MRCNRYISTNTPACVPAEKHPIMPPSNLSPLLVAPARVPPLLFPSLYLLISAGFGTKSHLGTATCQLRWAFTQKRQLLFNICLPGSKTFLFTPLTPPLAFSLCLSFPFVSTSRSHTRAAKTSHTLDRKQTKCSNPPPSSCLSPPLCHFSSPSGCPRLLCFLFSAFLDNCFPLCIMRETCFFFNSLYLSSHLTNISDFFSPQ